MKRLSEWDFPNAATLPGSAYYYVVRFCEKSNQNKLAYWFAWFDLLDEIEKKSKDPGVARIKIDWWKEEVKRILGNEARHPLAKELSQNVYSQQQVDFMIIALQALEEKILNIQPKTIYEYKENCFNFFGPRLYLLCNTLTSDKRILALAECIATVTWLSKIKIDSKKGHFLFPSEFFGKSIHGPNDLNQQIKNEEFEKNTILFLKKLNLIEKKDLKNMAVDQSIEPAIKYASQNLKLLKILKKNKFNPLKKNQLMPISLLLSAWRI